MHTSTSFCRSRSKETIIPCRMLHTRFCFALRVARMFVCHILWCPCRPCVIGRPVRILHTLQEKWAPMIPTHIMWVRTSLQAQASSQNVRNWCQTNTSPPLILVRFVHTRRHGNLFAMYATCEKSGVGIVIFEPNTFEDISRRDAMDTCAFAANGSQLQTMGGKFESKDRSNCAKSISDGL